eukprot:COSAG02_NODE_7960_length_2771_cov_3.466551_2_plen_106_part_00
MPGVTHSAIAKKNPRLHSQLREKTVKVTRFPPQLRENASSLNHYFAKGIACQEMRGHYMSKLFLDLDDPTEQSNPPRSPSSPHTVSGSQYMYSTRPAGRKIGLQS